MKTLIPTHPPTYKPGDNVYFEESLILKSGDLKVTIIYDTIVKVIWNGDSWDYLIGKYTDYFHEDDLADNYDWMIAKFNKI